MSTDSGQGGLAARRWQLQSAAAWLADRQSPNSDGARFAGEFSEAVTRLFARAVGDNVQVAREVIHQLGPTLTKCDELAFDQVEQALAYMLWHEVDRYHRVTQALDLLFDRGVLPVAKVHRQLRLLEVGSGPAPASYASVDYFAALGAWSRRQPTGFKVAGSVEAHTLDRGPAWRWLIHRLSEELLSSANSVSQRAGGLSSTFFDVTYTDLRGFDPRQLHNDSRDKRRQRLLEPWGDDEDPYFTFDVFDRDEADVLAARDAPPSAYDLIVVANFVTNDEMLQAFAPDLEVLARSLVPGGVLLILSAPDKKYQLLWGQFLKWAHQWQLDHEVDQVIRAHNDPVSHERVANATITALRHLDALVPNFVVDSQLPASVRAEVAASLQVRTDGATESAAEKFVSYPSFQVHAFKRGHRAISARERKRIASR